MTTTSQLMKNLRETARIAKFSANFSESIEILHVENCSCFLCISKCSICGLMELELALNGNHERIAKEKAENEKNVAECIQMFENCKKSPKKSQKKSKKKSEIPKSSKPRIVRTKFNGAPKLKKSEGEDKMSVDGNKFHRRFKKTKRNVRI